LVGSDECDDVAHADEQGTCYPAEPCDRGRETQYTCAKHSGRNVGTGLQTSTMPMVCCISLLLLGFPNSLRVTSGSTEAMDARKLDLFLCLMLVVDDEVVSVAFNEMLVDISASKGSGGGWDSAIVMNQNQ